MIKVHNGSPVPRYQVFVLADGNIAIQWTENAVQCLMTGAYCEYHQRDFGHRITDSELEQLKTAGVIESYDQAYVWVYALPEDARFGMLRTLQETSGASRARCYYINTTLSANRLPEFEQRFQQLDLSSSVCICEHEGLIAIMGKDAMPFANLKDAENVQRRLQTQLPELLESAAVAFTEAGSDFQQPDSNDESFIDLDELIASQTDTSVTRGKLALVACRDEEERRAVMRLLDSMEMSVTSVATAQETLNMLEEEPVDLLIMDVRLEDMHGWAMLGKLREIGHAHNTSIIVMAEQGADEQVFALTVAKVDVYLQKPLSFARLRQSIWSTLKEHQTGK